MLQLEKPVLHNEDMVSAKEKTIKSKKEKTKTCVMVAWRRESEFISLKSSGIWAHIKAALGLP